MVSLIYFFFAPAWLNMGMAFSVDLALCLTLAIREEHSDFVIYVSWFEGGATVLVGVYLAWLYEWGVLYALIAAAVFALLALLARYLSKTDGGDTNAHSEQGVAESLLGMLAIFCALIAIAYGAWTMRAFLPIMFALWAGFWCVDYWFTHADLADLSSQWPDDDPDETLARLNLRFVEATGQASDLAVVVAKGLLWLAGAGIVLRTMFLHPVAALSVIGIVVVLAGAYYKRCEWGKKEVAPLTTNDLLKGALLGVCTFLCEYLLWNYFYQVVWLAALCGFGYLSYLVLLRMTVTSTANPIRYMQHVFDKTKGDVIHTIAFVTLYVLDVIVNFLWVWIWISIFSWSALVFGGISSALGQLRGASFFALLSAIFSAILFFIALALAYRFYVLPILLACGMPRLEETGQSNNFRYAMRKGALGGLPATRIEHEKINAMLDRIEERAKALNIGFVRPQFIYMKDELGDNAFVTLRSLYIGRNLFVSNVMAEAVLAHEIGHMVLGHGAYRAGVASLFSVSLIQFIDETFRKDVSGEDKATNVFMFFFNAPIVLTLWTHHLLMHHTYREQEYMADMYATVLGYGNPLMSRLNTFGDRLDTSIRALANREHPYNRERIVMIEAALDGQGGIAGEPLNFMQFTDSAEAIHANDFPSVALASPIRLYKQLRKQTGTEEEMHKALNLQVNTVFPKQVIERARRQGNEVGLKLIASCQAIER